MTNIDEFSNIEFEVANKMMSNSGLSDLFKISLNSLSDVDVLNVNFDSRQCYIKLIGKVFTN